MLETTNNLFDVNLLLINIKRPNSTERPNTNDVPSIDTPVCDTMSWRFNEEAAQLPDSVEIYTLSLDLPFAQKRWCGAAGIKRIKLLSDYQERSFGLNYGVLIKELKLLARAVFVIDSAGKIAYQEIVKEVTDEPDYAAALAAVRSLV